MGSLRTLRRKEDSEDGLPYFQCQCGYPISALSARFLLRIEEDVYILTCPGCGFDHSWEKT
jgi:hypothetical protein